MEEFTLLRTLRGAIYGRVALVRHEASQRLFAVKMMSLAHMAAQRAVSGPRVQENGAIEMRILRRFGGNHVLRVTDNCQCLDDEIDNGCCASVHPQWDEHSRHGFADHSQHHHHLQTLHKDFVDEATGARCLVLEFCPFGELYDQLNLAPSKRLGVETARALFSQIAEAVQFMHAHGIAHRDISLENVLLDAARQCRVSDFGLASLQGSRCHGRVGKTFYMAPEVFAAVSDPDNSRPACLEFYDGLKADVWSLGILLFIMVTGVPPFASPSERDARFRVVKFKGLRSLLGIWNMEHRVTTELLDLLTQMLHVDPEDRLSMDQVRVHMWLQPQIDGQLLVCEGSFLDNMTPLSAMKQPEESGDGAIREPQEELGTESERDRLQTMDSGQLRSRKRMKIDIDNHLDSAIRLEPLLVDKLEQERSLLSHESPSGSTALQTGPPPNASPIMVWPRATVMTEASRSLFPAPLAKATKQNTTRE